MAAKKEEVPSVSMSNTKKEILEAFEQMKKDIEEKERAELQPEKKIEEKKKKDAVQVGDSMLKEDVTKGINNLKFEIGKMLSQITENLEEEALKYKKLTDAIDYKNKELHEVYEIERSAYDLTSLIEAQHRKRLDFDNEIAMKKTELEKEIEETRSAWEKEQIEHEQQLKERDNEEKKQRARQKEEFDYEFNRNKELEKNKLEDELEQLDKELKQKRENFEKEVSEKEQKLLERELKIKERETFMDKLEKQVENFPQELDQKIKQAVEETTERIEREHEKNITLLTKETEGEKNVLLTKIEALEKTVADQRKQIELISSQLDNAYTKVEQIAMKTVEGSSGKQTLSEIQHLFEQKKKQNHDDR